MKFLNLDVDALKKYIWLYALMKLVCNARAHASKQTLGQGMKAVDNKYPGFF